MIFIDTLPDGMSYRFNKVIKLFTGVTQRKKYHKKIKTHTNRYLNVRNNVQCNETQKHHTVGTILKYNSKIVERGKIDNSNT